MSDMFSALSESIELWNQILTDNEDENDEKEVFERFFSAILEYVEILRVHLLEVDNMVSKKVKKRKLNEVLEYSICVLEVLTLFISDEYLDTLDGFDFSEENLNNNQKIKALVNDILRVSFSDYPDFPDNTELIESAENNLGGVLRAVSEETKEKNKEKVKDRVEKLGKSIRVEYKGLSIEICNRSTICELYINGKLQDSLSGLFIKDMCKLQGKGLKNRKIIVVFEPKAKVFAKYEIWYKNEMIKSRII